MVHKATIETVVKNSAGIQANSSEQKYMQEHCGVSNTWSYY